MKIKILIAMLILYSFFVIAATDQEIRNNCKFTSTIDPNDLNEQDNTGPEVIIRYNEATNYLLISYYDYDESIRTGGIDAFQWAEQPKKISDNQYSFVKDRTAYYINKKLPEVCYYNKNEIAKITKESEISLECNYIQDKKTCEDSPVCRIEITQREQKGIFGSPVQSERFICITNVENFLRNCIDIQGTNNPKADRANIIILGYGYKNLGSIEEIAKKQIEKLFSLEPFRSNKDKFNVWLVNDIGNLDDCPKGNCPIDLALQSCPFSNPFYIFLVNDDFRSHSNNGIVYLSKWVSLPINSYVLAHEFGHSFANLYDEYIEEGIINISSLRSRMSTIHASNCFFIDSDSATIDNCLENAPWKEMLGNGCGEDGVIDCSILNNLYNVEVNCVQGCYYTNSPQIYRSGQNTLMHAHQLPPYLYGPWNEDLIKKIIDEYSGA